MDASYREQGSQNPKAHNSEARLNLPSTPAFDANVQPSPSIEHRDYDGDPQLAADLELSLEEEALTAEVETELKEEITIDPGFADLEEHDIAEGATTADPLSAESYFWTDPITTIKREIWRPGDGDGDRLTDFYDKPGPAFPFEIRWKLYQSRTGPGLVQAARNVPPKYVILDDRTAHEVLDSDIPRAQLAKYWPHDFAGNGSIRARRPNRGRGAIGDLEASGQERFYHTTIANRRDGERYYFTGESGYQPVIWDSEDWNVMIGVFKPEIKRLPTPPKKEPLKWNQHGHNQFTPKDQLVKYGAPRKGTSFRRFREKTRDANGNVRGGRNRIQPLAAMNAETAALSRSPESSHSRNSSKRRKVSSRSASEEADKNKENEDYIKRLEMFLVESKEITDKQKADIDALEQKLVNAERKVELLEAEVTRLQGD